MMKILPAILVPVVVTLLSHLAVKLVDEIFETV